MSARKFLSSKWCKVLVFAVSLAPLAYICISLLHIERIPDPAIFVQHAAGDWTIRFLIFTLAITPLRKILNLPELIRFRRMLGLFAFFYVFLHFLTYIVWDQSLQFSGMWADVMKRRYITVGFLGFVLLIPLAITSTTGWIRRLGGKRWRILHRAIYFAAMAGVIHYYWLVKSDVRKPLQYAAIVGALLIWRLYDWFIGRAKTIPAKAAVAS